MNNRRASSWFQFISVLTGVLIVLFPLASMASLESDLQQKQQQLSNAQAAAKNKAQEAQGLSTQIDNLDSGIKSTEQKIQQTDSQILGTQGEIDGLSSNIEVKNKELSELKTQLNSAIVELYRFSSRSDLELFFGSASLADSTNQSKYVEAVQLQVNAIFSKVKGVKSDLEKQKSDQEAKKAELDSLKNQQVAYKQGSEYQKSQKDKLLNMTVAQQQQYLALAEKYKGEISKIQAQINTLQGTRSWGTQIVAGGGVSWYYAQTGNYTRLGDSPFTVDLYGCLITSVAMVATYYGHNVSPTYIATNGSFSEGGYLLGYPSGIGVSVGGSQSINWSEVDSQISSGRPVIISVYLPSVGAINRDGSSHFVVIYGRSGDTYLMADPIGPGRGYNLNQVRSMKIITN